MDCLHTGGILGLQLVEKSINYSSDIPKLEGAFGIKKDLRYKSTQ